MKKATKAGRKANGNITIDLGESIEKKLRSAGMAGRYSPGRYGSPWSPSHRWTLGERMGIPERLETSQVLTGGLLGTAGNRLLTRVIPGIVGVDQKLVVDAIATAVGLVPFFAKRNSLTVGIALPGLVFLTGTLSEWALDQLSVPRPILRGASYMSARDASLAARQKLAEIQAKVAPRSYQRVAAQTRYAS